MGELVNYSIETDQTVLLEFASGHQTRVPIQLLAQYLRPADLARVKQALRLRRRFLQDHMPRAAAAIIITGLATMLMLAGRVVAVLWPSALPAAPDTTLIGGDLGSPGPVAAVHTIQPGVPRSRDDRGRIDSSVNAVLANTRAIIAQFEQVVPSTALAADAGKAAVAAGAASTGTTTADRPAVTATPLPAPDPASTVTPAPTPEASPTPSPTPSSLGQVLGDSTGPSDPPSPSPAP